MELDSTRKQPQETRGIKPRRSTKREGTCKDKITLASLGNKANRKVNILDMPEKVA